LGIDRDFDVTASTDQTCPTSAAVAGVYSYLARSQRPPFYTLNRRVHDISAEALKPWTMITAMHWSQY